VIEIKETRNAYTVLVAKALGKHLLGKRNGERRTTLRWIVERDANTRCVCY
jgi:hypothetical protein